MRDRSAAVSLLLVLVPCLLLGSAGAAAQRTGGSFGGSSRSWGGSSSSHGSTSTGTSGSSSFGSSRSYGSSSSNGSSRTYGSSSASSSSRSSSSDTTPATSGSSSDHWRRARVDRGEPPITERERAAMEPRVPLWGYYLGVVGVLFGLTWAPAGIRAGWRRMRSAALRRARSRPAQLRRVSVGFDWTVREALQRELAALAGSLSLETGRDRARAASSVVTLLREHLSGARYACSAAVSTPISSAPGELARLADDLRARFTHETRGRGGSEAPELCARPEEGAGLVVVSLVIGSAAKPRALGDARDRRSLDALLDELVPERELDGLEVIWSPAEADDRMSSYELERFYPELVRLAEAGEVGTARCGHCAALRPRELERCPHCGSSEIG